MVMDITRLLQFLIVWCAGNFFLITVLLALIWYNTNKIKNIKTEEPQLKPQPENEDQEQAVVHHRKRAKRSGFSGSQKNKITELIAANLPPADIAKTMNIPVQKIYTFKSNLKKAQKEGE